jgi:hypothetical protein
MSPSCLRQPVVPASANSSRQALADSHRKHRDLEKISQRGGTAKIARSSHNDAAMLTRGTARDCVARRTGAKSGRVED